MYFKRIELNGFKSFADPVSIDFTDGITCIVGPNGSGKSNISDAIRWVLGEQSPKTLRGGKMEEVIFAGTQNRRPKGMAEVTLVIDNSSHILPIDFAEVGITRRIYRSGENEYMINHAPCRLKDIRELIMDTGIGVEGYSIIGQGRIADIVDNKMDSRRELFEEAAGVVKYRNRKAEAEKKLDSASLNLDRINDIVGEIESRIGGLEEDSRKATEYLALRDKYRDIEINIILRNIEQAEEKSKAVEGELAELETAVEELQKGRDEADSRLREEREKVEKVDAEIDSLRDRLLAINNTIHEIGSSVELNKERRAALARDRQRLSDELAAADEKIERETANLSAASETSAQLEKELGELRGGLSQKAGASAELEAMEKAEAEKAEAARSRIFEAAGRFTELSAEAASLENMRSVLESRKEKLLADEGASAANDEDLKNRLKEAENRAEELKKEASGLTEKIKAAKLAEYNAMREEAEAGARLAELRVVLGKKGERRTVLEELEKAYEGYSGGVRFIMKQKLSGIKGVLGELISVPQGWETAIETELGNKLQDVVCEDDGDAKRAIDLLKKNQAGRLTFLPLRTLKVQPLPDTALFERMAGFLGRASDKVTGEGIEKIVDYVLGRVVVVDKLDNALAMSAKNSGPMRFVTLEGDIVNAAGAITGGSARAAGGNILSRKAEKKALETEIEGISSELESCSAARKRAAEELEKQKDARSTLELASREAETKLAVTGGEIRQLSALVSESIASGEKRGLEISDLSAEIEGSAAKIEEIGRARDSAKEEQAKAEAESLEAAASLEDIRNRLSAARAAETAANLEATAAAERSRSAKEIEERIRLGIEELKAERAARLESFREVEARAEETADSDAGAEEKIKACEAEKAAAEDKLRELGEEKKLASASALAIEEERGEADKKLFDKQISKHDATSRLARFGAQTEALKDRLWDEFELSYAQAAERELEDFVMSRAQKESREYRDRIKQLGDVNIGAIEEYKAVKERYDFLTEQRADVVKAMEELRGVINDMDSVIRKQYRESFDLVVTNFEKIFSELFNGGNARLTMSDPEDPLQSTVEIEAQPPGKKLQNINLLSGGEKTMTAIALMFALLKAKPTPFCILDEVEAALDDANIDRFANYLKNFTETQFTLVTHQKATMEHASVLYGVTMAERGISRVLSLKVGDDFDLGN